MTAISPGPDHRLAGAVGVRRGPAGPRPENSLARWGGRRLGFPTPYSNYLSREPILDGLLSDEPGLATLIPRAGNEVPQLGRLLAILWVRSGLRGATQFDVRGPRVSIGRDPGNDVVLDSPAVGGRHALLSLAAGVWTLTNLEATNGTWVDGARVEDSISLAPGSELRIAGVVLSFAPRDTWSDSPVAPEPDRPAPVLSGPLFLASDEATKPNRLIVRAAVVLIVCLLAYILLGSR